MMLANKLLSAMAGGTEKLYVDDVFQTWLSAGTGTARTVTGPDMTKGGLSITKSRSAATGWHFVDTARGAGNSLSSNSTAASVSEATGLTAFTSTGASIGSAAEYNTSGATYVDYLIRKAPKFFDVVTWSGDNASSRLIPHSLGIAPGFFAIKETNGASHWVCYHQSVGTGSYLLLNSPNASASSGSFPWVVSPTDINVGTTGFNTSGKTYVAYIFAHDTAADGIIQCGSYVTTTGGTPVDLGWEAQWVMEKRVNDAGDWMIADVMRGMDRSGYKALEANNSQADEVISGEYYFPTATGYINKGWSAGQTVIYLAIRRPNKPPTTGTQVYNAIARTGGGSNVSGVGFAPDLVFSKRRDGGRPAFYDKLRGAFLGLDASASNAELLNYDSLTSYTNSGITVGADGTMASLNYSGLPYSTYFIRRAPGVFDVVCYTGTGVARTVPHNFGVAPELMIVKRRDGSAGWLVYAAPQGNTVAGQLESTTAFYAAQSYWNNTSPTGSALTVGGDQWVNASGGAFVAYLFASLPGISKVGSYTGNGTTQTINCGFTTGARFFLVKAASTTGSWWVYDSSRGIVAAADPALQLNSTAAEVTSADAVDPTSVGIIVNQEATCSINATGVSYIYLAIA